MPGESPMKAMPVCGSLNNECIELNDIPRFLGEKVASSEYDL